MREIFCSHTFSSITTLSAGSPPFPAWTTNETSSSGTSSVSGHPSMEADRSGADSGQGIVICHSVILFSMFGSTKVLVRTSVVKVSGTPQSVAGATAYSQVGLHVPPALSELFVQRSNVRPLAPCIVLHVLVLSAV